MTIVPNEWLVDMMMGPPGDQRVVNAFLDRVERGGHLLAIRHGSPHGWKLQGALKHHDVLARSLAKRVWLILWDPGKVIRVFDDEIGDVPDWVAAEVRASDVYLVETALSRRPSVLVTTDFPLFEAVSRHPEIIEVSMLNEFMTRLHQA